MIWLLLSEPAVKRYLDNGKLLDELARQKAAKDRLIADFEKMVESENDMMRSGCWKSPSPS